MAKQPATVSPGWQFPPARRGIGLLTTYMNQRLAHVALLVRNYDEAIAFYTQRMGFVLSSD